MSNHVRTTITIPRELHVALEPYRESGQVNVSKLTANAIKAFLRGEEAKTPLSEYSISELTEELNRRAQRIEGKED